MSSAPETTTELNASLDVERLTHAVETSGRHAWAGRIGTYPLRKGWLRVTHEGLENVPTDGGVIIAANHLAFIDSVLLMYALPRTMHFLGKAEYLENPIASRIFPSTGMMPLDRSGKRARITLDRAQNILENGGVVGVHPEGTRSRDGLLAPAHKGVAQMALRANVPVVPVGLIGTDQVQPVGQKLPSFRGEVTVRWGAPIGLGPWATRRRSATSRRELTDEIMTAIAALSGQQRRPETAPATTGAAVLSAK